MTTENTVTTIANHLALPESGQRRVTALRQATVFCCCAAGVLFTLCCNHSLQAAGNVDLDGDGIADEIDLDQDNDGLLNSVEGYLPNTPPFATEVVSYQAGTGEALSSQIIGSEFTYRLLDYNDVYAADMVGRIRSTDTLVDWAFHDNLPKLRNQTAGTTYVEWHFQNPLDGEMLSLSADLTISDLDVGREETVIVEAASIVGYSLSETTAVAVFEEDGNLRFSAVSGSDKTVDRSVTLHLRRTTRVVIGYENRAHSLSVKGISNDAAGYRHSLRSQTLANYHGAGQSLDTDQDGIADHRDLDSDNDGVNDVDEAGGLDQDLDAMADGRVDGSGVPSSARQGAVVVVDKINTVTSVGIIDEDRDGIIDPFDTRPDGFGESAPDSDGDGLNDLQERRLGTDINNPDSDRDGVSDLDEVTVFQTNPLDPPAIEPPQAPVSTHEDRDSDADNDGLSDQLEGMQDTDEDGLPNQFDLDSDNDGIADLIEAGGQDIDGNGRADPDGSTAWILTGAAPDFDSDGVADYLDSDSDNDGLSDLVETSGTDDDGNGRIDQLSDSNSDGWDDRYLGMPVVLRDSDSDGNPDFLDRIVPTLLLDDEAHSDTASATPVLHTGVDGGFGCVMGNGPRRNDFTLLLLLVFSLAQVTRRARKSKPGTLRPILSHL